jgi:hypothetical protein
MVISVHQPAYLAWRGYFDRIAAADLHVMLDHVAFQKNGLQNRNRVRSGDGWTWLTVPVRAHLGVPLNAITIDDGRDWGRKHWRTLEQEYGRYPSFQLAAPFWREVLYSPWPRLIELTDVTMKWILWALGVKTPIVRGSDLGVAGRKGALVLNLCRHLGATTYLSGPQGRDYLDQEAFEKEGIEVKYDDYRPDLASVVDGVPLSVVDEIFRREPNE